MTKTKHVTVGELLFPKGIRWTLIGVVCVVLLVIITAAYSYYRQEKKGMLQRVSNELTSVTRLKSAQLSGWYADELHDIRLLASNDVVLALYERWRLTGAPMDRNSLTRQLSALRDEHGYTDLFLCTSEGLRYYTDSDSVRPCNSELRALIPVAMRSTEAVSTDIYICPHHGDYHLDFVAAFGMQKRSTGVMLVGRYDPARYVFPVLEQWPTASPSSETLLARRDGDSIRIVSNQRNRPRSALRRVYSINDTALAIVQAARGRTGLCETKDYRGKRVLAYLRPVPRTPWIMVSKTDRDEVFTDLYFEMGLILALVLAGIAAVTVGMFHFFSQRESEMYRAMFEEHGAVKLILDPDSGAIVDANQAAADFYQWSREELRRMYIQDINILPAAAVSEELMQTVAAGRLHHEFRHRRADGSIRDVEVFAGALRIRRTDLIYSIIHDVTEKKEGERSIKLLGRSVEQSPVTIVITNPEGEIEYVNPEFTKVTGYASEEAVGHKANILNSGHHSREFYADLWGTIIAGGEWIGEICNRKKDGTLFWERAVIAPVLDDEGVITHMIGIKTDITAEKHLLSELVTAKERAEESDRLKSAFLANMSHEIRTPMNTIVGFADFLIDPDLSMEDRAEFTAIIRQRSYDLLTIINDILDISRIEAGEVKIVEEESDVTEILQDLLISFRHMANRDGGRRVDFRCVNELRDGENRIIVDASRLRQVMTNLLSNAFKFTHEGTITFGCRKWNEMEFLFYVADTGIGIAPEHCAYIFDRFRQADDSSTRRYGGTGLGLAISQGIVDLMGGKIWVESTPGRGSTFHFTIPRKSVA
jgi:PAS domain S-box-containing protein